MITYEQDPDVIRWGLQLFDSDPYSNCGGYCGTLAQDHGVNQDYYQGQYFNEDQYDAESCNIANDELIAHALQEELSHLAVAEVPRSPNEVEDHLQVSSFQQDWFGQSMVNYVSGIC